MASKFQNRLVGTVILVALGVILLPGLLDGKKKHYEDEFASIPLVPKPGDVQEQEPAGPITQSLPAQPPEGAGEAVNAGAAEAAHAVASSQDAPDDETEAAPRAPAAKATPKTLTPPPVAESRQQQPKAQQPPKAVAAKKAEAKPVESPKAEAKPQAEAAAKPPAEAKEPAAEKPPVAQSYVVQLGALKNADKVNEIVAKLRLSGYRAYTLPATPVQGQITRVFVGPEANKQKLEGSLETLKDLSGLSGQVRGYSAAH